MRQHSVMLLIGTALIGIALIGCSTAAAPGIGTMVTGQWGAPRASLTLTESGGTIEYDCAHGGLNAAVHPDGAGRFEVSGVHVREHGGPVRVGEVPDSIPARYIGVVRGDRMTLRVVVGADTLGPFELQRNAAAQLVRCL